MLRERGIRVLLIPHLWVETTGWRGEVDPGTPEGWRWDLPDATGEPSASASIVPEMTPPRSTSS